MTGKTGQRKREACIRRRRTAISGPQPKGNFMRRFALAVSLVLIAAGAAAQPKPGTTTWQLNTEQASITAAKTKFRLVAGALQWNDASPEQSTVALSLDTTSLGDDGLKTQFDAAHFPEMRLISTAPGKKSGDKESLPSAVTIKDITKPVTLQLSFKTVSRSEIDLHAEGTIRGGDFKMKGGDMALVIDAPFVRVGPN
jgi:polyisoprenoid-binding protein YceI